MVDRRAFMAIGSGALLALNLNERAHGQVTTRRIGVLSGWPRPEVEFLLSQLRPELEKLGWTEGRNIVFLEPRTSDGDNARLSSAAAGLVAEGPDLILVETLPAIRALMQATKSIPIVMISVGNPVDFGIVTSYVKPGGNVTGSSYLVTEYMLKLMQLLKEAAPRLHSVAVFLNPTNEASAPIAKQMRSHAVTLGVQLQIVDVTGKGDFDAAFAAIRNANTESILLGPDPVVRSNRDAVVAFAESNGLPLGMVGAGRRGLPASALIAYGPPREEYPRLAARYVDQILKGAKPGDLSIEQPTRFTLTINLKAARALGLAIPQSLIVRADEVIQ